MKELLIALAVAAIPLTYLYFHDRGSFRGGLGVAAGCVIGYASAMGWLPLWAVAVAVVVITVSLAGIAEGWWDPRPEGGGR